MSYYIGPIILYTLWAAIIILAAILSSFLYVILCEKSKNVTNMRYPQGMNDRVVYICNLYKELSLEFLEGCQVWQKTPEEG